MQKLTVRLSDLPIGITIIGRLLLLLLLLRAEWEYLAGVRFELLPPLLEVEIRLLQLEEVVAEFLDWNGSVVAVLRELLGILEVPFHQLRLTTDVEGVRRVLREFEIQTLKGLLGRLAERGVAKGCQLMSNYLKSMRLATSSLWELVGDLNIIFNVK